MERLAILCDSETIEPRHLPPEIKGFDFQTLQHELPRKWNDFKAYKQQVQENAASEVERQFLIGALQQAGGNVSKAAANVGMQRSNFHHLLRKHKISSKSFS